MSASQGFKTAIANHRSVICGLDPTFKQAPIVLLFALWGRHPQVRLAKSAKNLTLGTVFGDVLLKLC